MILDFTVLDTTPGGSSFCSPPAGWVGDATAYVDWLRGRYRADPGFAQYMVCAAWKGIAASNPRVEGPFAGDLKKALAKLA